MKHSFRFLILLIPLLILGFAFTLTIPAQAGSQQQVYYVTNTPDETGRILYTVQEGDSCLVIELLTGVKVSQIVQLNNLDEACTLREGQQLVLAYYETPTVTAGPSPTLTPILPTATPFNGNGEVCVYLFDDVNGNGNPEGSEAQIAGGAVSITDREGKVNLTGNTLGGVDPLCFAEVPEGEYNVSVAPPEGYNATTAMNYPLVVRAGDQSLMNFGAQGSSSAIEPIGEGGKSPIMLILGAILILAGGGVGFYFFKMKR
jgi:hypothetical protein